MTIIVIIIFYLENHYAKCNKSALLSAELSAEFGQK